VEKTMPTTRGNVFDNPPPGGGLNTDTKTVPPTAVSAADIEAVRWFGDTKVVARGLPFQRTTAPGAKLMPMTVSVNAGPPIVAEPGINSAMVATGFTGPPVTKKLTPFDRPPPGVGLATVTVNVPATARSLAGIET